MSEQVPDRSAPLGKSSSMANHHRSNHVDRLENRRRHDAVYNLPSPSRRRGQQQRRSHNKLWSSRDNTGNTSLFPIHPSANPRTHPSARLRVSPLWPHRLMPARALAARRWRRYCRRRPNVELLISCASPLSRATVAGVAAAAFDAVGRTGVPLATQLRFDATGKTASRYDVRAPVERESVARAVARSLVTRWA